ncbi:MAG: hypothetical protein ACR2OE_15040 [Thermomicrobiales bacterium]
MTYGWDDDSERELADDGHSERIDEDDGCDTALPPELLWCEPDPEDDDNPNSDQFDSFEKMAEDAMWHTGGLA